MRKQIPIRLSLWSLLSLVSLGASADLVHVIEQTEVDGVTNVVRDTTKLTGMPWATATVPSVSGQIFTHWTISTIQDFSSRDAWGRAHDAPIFMLYEDTTLTAHYLPASQDSDADGIADGYEIYWYGDLSQTGDSDTDGDGSTFAQELANGTNPLVGDEGVDGPIGYGDGILNLYNPSNYVPYTIKSDPEGALFATTTEYVRKGTYVTTGTQGTANGFAYWRVNGVERRDAWGRAVESVNFMMPTNAVELVAVKVSGDSDADGLADNLELYWYGDLDEDADSDTDDDGSTFAQELANGTNPLVGDEDVDGPIGYSDGDLMQYNPNNYQPYLMRSEPEGVLFATVSNYVTSGLFVSTGTQDLYANGLAYWTLNGVEQRDAWGHALDNLNVQMPTNALTLIAHVVTNATDRAKLYWYGTTDVDLESDTDGDGYTFAQELANGTSPHVGDETVDGPITYADTELHETNLQVYEQVIGALVDGKYTELFTSPIAGNGATSRTFGESKVQGEGEGEGSGSQIWPVVADVNGDGLWDMIVCSATTTNVFVNTGSKGNPQFAKCGSVGADVLGGPHIDLNMNSTAKLAGMTLDVAPVGALSATTNGATMLVSDEEGRIWYYVDATSSSRQNEDGSTSIGRGGDTASTWALQHKVWGGSYAGFANGLMLAAVDWEDDGDLDCLCGTAEGKLMLLRDPKVGRPTGLVAEAGVDSVKLEWEPNGQSRVRGYRVYRAVDAESSPRQDEDDFVLIGRGGDTASTALPRYLDLNLEPSTYSYKVSALSRFYTAGNSTPTETESIATEPVSATVGGVTLSWSEPVWRLNCDKSGAVVSSNVVVDLIINNSLNYDAAGLVVSNVYDAAKWRFLKVEATGLSEKLKWETVDCEAPVDAASSPRREEELIGSGDAVGTPRPRAVTLTVSLGEVAAGGGKFFTFVFEDLTAEPKVLMGDVDGNGVLEGVVIGPGHAKRGDLWLLGKLKDDRGRNWTAYQLKAGDFNGNGKLDNADYQALRALLRERGVL